MQPPETTNVPTTAPTVPARPSWWRWMGFCLGVILLVGALKGVMGNREALAQAADSIRKAGPWLFAAAFVLPLANWILSAEIFRILLLPGRDERHQSPSRGEMLELIGVSWLANYSPVSPGLFFRLGWHKARAGISLARSVHSVILASIASVVAVFALLLSCWIAPGGAEASRLWAVAAIVAPPILFAVVSLPAGRVRLQWRWFLLACSVRCLDVIAWMGRYAAAFTIAGGVTPDLREVAAVAAVSQAAMLVPVVGNGLGIREVAVGLATAWLPSWYAGGSLHGADGVMADVVNRAGELAAALVTGAVCGVLLTRRLNAGDRT